MKWFILAAIPLGAQVRDPADRLIEVRDRVLANAQRLPKVSCTQTIERSYFIRVNPPDRALSCDQISVDRKKGRIKMKLYATDRIRVKAMLAGGGEVFAWDDPLPFEAHGLEEILEAGPISTGALGAYLMDLFSDADAHFQYLGEKDGKIEYGFRESDQASRHVVKAGERWVPTAHSGSFLVDPKTMDPTRFQVETSTLPRETSICESASTVEYRREKMGAEEVLLPVRAESHDVLISTQETNSVSRYSGCTAEVPRRQPAVKAEGTLPERVRIPLAFEDPIDTDTAAAGDLVAARVTQDVTGRDGLTILVHQGSRVRGRILNVEHWIAKATRKSTQEKYFAIAISFDVLEFDGVATPLRVRLDPEGLPPGSLTLTDGSDRWPENTLVFETRENRVLVRRGFESKWMTVK